MKVEWAHFSRQGRKSANEDSVLPPLSFGDIWWAAVADGMGGRPGGEIASATVIKAISCAIESQHPTSVTELFNVAHKHLQTVSVSRPELHSMGTTLSLVRFCGSEAEVGHVGDSRIYHLRGDGIVDRTVDQTEVEQLVQQGVLSKARARRYPRRHVLLSVLSPNKSYDLYKSEFKIKGGDRLILLTDGVSSKLLRREVRDLSLVKLTPQALCDSLATEIETRIPEDDYSAICIDIKAV